MPYHERMSERPRLLITMGDVAGIGPEVIARAWPQLNQLCRPIVIGDCGWLRRAFELVGVPAEVAEVSAPGQVEPSPRIVPCLSGSKQDLEGVVRGQVSAAA